MVLAQSHASVRSFTMVPGEFDQDVAREQAALTAYPKEGGVCRNTGFQPVKVTVHPREPKPDETWRTKASCLGMDTALFFPHQGDPAPETKAVCVRCPVNVECFEYGLRETHGIWGGVGERRRRVIRRERGFGWNWSR